MPSMHSIVDADCVPLAPYGLQSAQRLRMDIGGQALEVQLIGFDAARFHADAYRHAAMPLPPHILHSRQIRQAEFFFGRLAARLALQAHAPRTLEVPTGPNREPVWPAGMLGSISHNRHRSGAVALPCGTARGIGLDLEAPGTAEQHDAIASVAINADELALVAASPLAFGQTMTLFFSAKESFYKAVYGDVGHFFDFQAISIAAIDAAAGALRFTVRQHLSANWPAGATGIIRYTYLDDADLLTLFLW